MTYPTSLPRTFFFLTHLIFSSPQFSTSHFYRSFSGVRKVWENTRRNVVKCVAVYYIQCILCCFTVDSKGFTEKGAQRGLGRWQSAGRGGGERLKWFVYIGVTAKRTLPFILGGKGKRFAGLKNLKVITVPVRKEPGPLTVFNSGGLLWSLFWGRGRGLSACLLFS